jgi:hypothetical protein
MEGWPVAWFRHLSIGQKLLVSFGAILTVLVLSFTTLLLYLSHVNSYVDRHQRITVPAVVTAAEMRRYLSALREDVHLAMEHPAEAEVAETIRHIETLRSQIDAALATYSSTHAARTHPILFGMLTEHHRIDLADREDEAISAITAGLKEFDGQHDLLSASVERYRPDVQRVPEGLVQYDRTVTELERNIDTLIDVHRRIDKEMKIEGDRLVNEARLIVLGVTALLAMLIVST